MLGVGSNMRSRGRFYFIVELTIKEERGARV